MAKKKKKVQAPAVSSTYSDDELLGNALGADGYWKCEDDVHFVQYRFPSDEDVPAWYADASALITRLNEEADVEEEDEGEEGYLAEEEAVDEVDHESAAPEFIAVAESIGNEPVSLGAAEALTDPNLASLVDKFNSLPFEPRMVSQGEATKTLNLMMSPDEESVPPLTEQIEKIVQSYAETAPDSPTDLVNADVNWDGLSNGEKLSHGISDSGKYWAIDHVRGFFIPRAIEDGEELPFWYAEVNALTIEHNNQLRASMELAQKKIAEEAKAAVAAADAKEATTDALGKLDNVTVPKDLVVTHAQPLPDLSDVVAGKVNVDPTVAAATAEQADSLQSTGNTAAANPAVDVLISELRRYEDSMAKGKRQMRDDGPTAQIRLYHILRGILTTPNYGDFQSAMTQALRIFRENRTGAFEWGYVYRYFEIMKLNATDLESFKKFINLFLVMSEPQTRKEALAQINLGETLSSIKNEEHRERAISYFRGR